MHHRTPRSLGGGGGANLIKVPARPHLCHHGIASNFQPWKAITCYLIVHIILYGWKGRFIVTSAEGYEHRCSREINRRLLPSRMSALKAASLVLFGDYPHPRQVAQDLEDIWMPLGTNIDYVSH